MMVILALILFVLGLILGFITGVVCLYAIIVEDSRKYKAEQVNRIRNYSDIYENIKKDSEEK